MKNYSASFYGMLDHTDGNYSVEIKYNDSDGIEVAQYAEGEDPTQVCSDIADNFVEEFLVQQDRKQKKMLEEQTKQTKENDKEITSLEEEISSLQQKLDQLIAENNILKKNQEKQERTAQDLLNYINFFNEDLKKTPNIFENPFNRFLIGLK